MALIGALLLTGCADAGKDQSVVSGESVTLDANASTPSLKGRITRYHWKQVKGKRVVLSGKNTIRATFTAPVVTEITKLRFKLNTIETGGYSSPFRTHDFVTITVQPHSNANHPPHAVATVSPQTVEEGESVTFDGSSSTDSDGEIVSYKWLTASGETLSSESHFSHAFTTAGVETITLEVTDNDGEANSTSVTVTVTQAADTTAPVITLNGDTNVTLTVGDVYTEQGATATDDRDGNVTVTRTGRVDTGTAGTYTVTYTATDAAGNTATATRTVTVTQAADTTKPVITLNGDANVTLAVGDNYIDAGATASDNVDGNITANIVMTGQVDTNTVGTYTLSYTVNDSAGNQADTVIRTVHVVNLNSYGFIVTPLVGTSSQVSFAIVLKHKPESNVTINYSSADETVANPTTSTITFTPDNWYRRQAVTVNILNQSSSTEIVFEPTTSSDSNYNNKMLEQVPIVSHQLLLFEPVDKIIYSEFNMSIPINMAYVGDNEANITVTLDTAPAGMILDVNNSRLLWNPPVSMEGENSTVAITVSDGSIVESKTFELHVAHPTLLTTSIVNDKLVITDGNSSLNGLSIQALDGAVLADYRLYKLSASDTPALVQGESVVGKTLLIKGNVGKKVQVHLPLQGLVKRDEMLSFHTKNYFGFGDWRRVDYDYDFVGTLNEPVYVLNMESLFGVMAFTKVIPSQQKVSSIKQKNANKAYATQKNASSIHCVPQTWSFLNLTDYDNQICTFDDKPNFTLQIFNHKQFHRPIEKTASWVIQAQDKLIELGMPYRNYSALSFEDTFPESHGHTSNYDKVHNFFVDYPTIRDFKLSLIHTFLSYRDTQVTIYHEYFHQSQGAIQNSTSGIPKAKWLIESSAVWFSDYVDNNSGYAYEMFFDYIRLLSYGLTRLHTETMSGGGYGTIRTDIVDSNFYHRSIFLEMIEKYCTGFTKHIPYLFHKDDNDITSLQHLSTVVQSSNCNFGTPTGAGNESKIETALLYYQYISAIRNNKHLINQNLGNHFNFSGLEIPYEVSSVNSWSKISLDDYIDISHKEHMNNSKSIDTQALTWKFNALHDTLPKCQERYIHIKSEKTILVSLASNDAGFPDTPNTMLGDMKQINFGMVGITDFTYFYSPTTGKQIYPEMYLTIIDAVDDTSTLTPQNIELGIGLRRNNLLSHIDGKDMCAEYVSPINNTTVTANGDIPSQYRDSSDALHYIDGIKITCLESGDVFTATVNTDGTWSTTINITFNGNESRFSIEGYNTSNPQRIIANQGLTIVS